MSPISLFELNRFVRDLLLLSFHEELWVTAEISEIRRGSKGHYHVEFVEKEDCAAGQFRAKARGNIWQSTASTLLPKFKQATGQQLQAGLKVLVKVKVSFHEVYGYSLNVFDIDPTYTIGDMARRRQEILHQLEEDGVLTLNKELTLPRLIKRIAVISSSGAAGFGDFNNQLTQSEFVFKTGLFEATMQGVEVENSIISALNRIAQQSERWDCVVIIRGGGAVSDLNGFDTYPLAANIAQFPLPILTGIGHERDETIIDFVAHTRLKTPTAVAAYLIQSRQEEWERLLQWETKLFNATKLQISQKQMLFDRIATRYQAAAHDFIQIQHKRLQSLSNRLQLKTQERLLTSQNHLNSLLPRLRSAALHTIQRHEHRLEKTETTIQMADPKRILQLGYSITLDQNGKALKDTAALSVGSIIHTHLADGSLTSRIITKD